MSLEYPPDRIRRTRTVSARGRRHLQRIDHGGKTFPTHCFLDCSLLQGNPHPEHHKRRKPIACICSPIHITCRINMSPNKTAVSPRAVVSVNGNCFFGIISAEFSSGNGLCTPRVRGSTFTYVHFSRFPISAPNEWNVCVAPVILAEVPIASDGNMVGGPDVADAAGWVEETEDEEGETDLVTTSLTDSFSSLTGGDGVRTWKGQHFGVWLATGVMAAPPPKPPHQASIDKTKIARMRGSVVYAQCPTPTLGVGANTVSLFVLRSGLWKEGIVLDRRRVIVPFIMRIATRSLDLLGC